MMHTNVRIEAQTDSCSILLVFHEKSLLETLSRMCRRKGYTVYIADQGWNDVACLHRHPVDLVLLGMPVCSAVDVKFLAEVSRLYPAKMRLPLPGLEVPDEPARTAGLPNTDPIECFFSKARCHDELISAVINEHRARRGVALLSHQASEEPDPDRMQRISQLQEQVRTGRYQVNSCRVAEAMINMDALLA